MSRLLLLASLRLTGLLWRGHGPKRLRVWSSSLRRVYRGLSFESSGRLSLRVGTKAQIPHSGLRSRTFYQKTLPEDTACANSPSRSTRD